MNGRIRSSGGRRYHLVAVIAALAAAAATVWSGAGVALAVGGPPPDAGPPPQPVGPMHFPRYGQATVDGAISEWNLTTDFFSDMYVAANPDMAVLGQAYLRYDCSSQTVYVLVLPLPAYPLIVDGVTITLGDNSTKVVGINSWGVINSAGTKAYTSESGNDGTPPDFAYYGRGLATPPSYDPEPSNYALGYEASFTLAPGVYDNIGIHSDVAYQGSTATNGTSGAVGQGATTPITIDCTQAIVTVTKTVVNDNGGAASAGDFTLSLSQALQNATAQSFSGSANGSERTVYPGPYSVGETAGPSGYAASFGSSCSGYVGPGGSAACTITNDDIAPSLTLVKNVVGDGTASDWTLTATGPTTISGTGGVASGATFSAGTYTLSESTGPAGYDASAWSCSGVTPSVGVSGTTITLALAQQATCTITNTKRGRIVINKVTVPNTDTTTSFSFSATYGSFSLAGGSSNDSGYTLPPGTAASPILYSVTEEATSGWTLTALGVPGDTTKVCDSTNSTGSNGTVSGSTVTITLQPGETVTCTFENTRNSTTGAQAATRTQGYWATHLTFTTAKYAGLSPAEQDLCGDGGAKLGDVNKFMGGFWANIANKTVGGKRTDLDKARMQLMQQLLAAILNVNVLGANDNGAIAAGKAAYCGTSASAATAAAGALGAFNQSGDNVAATVGIGANGKSARQAANLTNWDSLP